MLEVTHQLVRTHSETGRKSLSLNPNRMEEIVGLERAESDRLLDELIAHSTQGRYQCRHVWRQGDIVIWDNRCTMHKANADYSEGERRLMHRVNVAANPSYLAREIRPQPVESVGQFPVSVGNETRHFSSPQASA